MCNFGEYNNLINMQMYFGGAMKPTLVVLAAGLGSRYGGVKQIDSVGPNGECLLDYATYDAKRAGFGNVVYIIRHDIENDFRERLFNRVARNFDASYVFQEKSTLLTDEQIAQSKDREKPWGTAHALLCAQNAIKTPFAVINSDDYYGAQAFNMLSKYLSQVEPYGREHAMVGYELGKTLSPSGAVSRGVCTIFDNRLASIEENLKIHYLNGPSSSIVSTKSDGDHHMTGSEWVSMNLFGFTMRAFESFQNYWDDFIKKNITEPKAEALLPAVAGNIVKSGAGSINFFASDEKWFGMTYSEDRPLVKDAISKKIADGYYPSNLWEL